MSADYEVGYKRPPPATQFKKGQSGNPRGRQKLSRNLKSDLAEELASCVNITVQGKTKRVSKQQALIMGLVTRAIKGDARAAALVTDMTRKMFPDKGSDDREFEPPPHDQEILDAYVQRQASPRGDVK